MRAAAVWMLALGGAAAIATHLIRARREAGTAVDPSTVATASATRTPTEEDPGNAEIRRYRLEATPTWEAWLPDQLTEISGLAFSSDGRLFAHGDEDATIWQLDPRSGAVRKTFALASGAGEAGAGDQDAPRGEKGKNGVVTGDFEDIAIAGDRFLLVTSTGTLYEFSEGDNGARVRYSVHPTGLDGACEVEGLAYDAPKRDLLLLCKTNLPRKSARRQVVVRSWSLDDGRLDPRPRLAVDYGAFAGAASGKGFNGSALAFIPGTESLLLIAGPQRSFAELTADGRVAAAGSLDRRVHRQPEGVAFAPDGTMIIANEGAGGRPSLSGYTPTAAAR
jgi:uncharacterized protein YjiK